MYVYFIDVYNKDCTFIEKEKENLNREEPCWSCSYDGNNQNDVPASEEGIAQPEVDILYKNYKKLKKLKKLMFPKKKSKKSKKKMVLEIFRDENYWTDDRYTDEEDFKYPEI